jgi:hypothetical protein
MDRRLAVFIILMIACATALTVAAHFFSVFPFDLKISEELKEEQNPVFSRTMEWVSIPGESWIEAVLAATVIAICLVRQRRREAVFVLATLSSVVLTSILKVLVGRPRPATFPLNPAVIQAGMSSSILYSLVSSPFLAGRFLKDTRDGSP